MVEFAIISPLALLLVLGIVQLGLMFVAREVVDEAAFVAARAGAVNNAQVDAMRSALQRALIPFYQDTTTTNDTARIGAALGRSLADTLIPCSSTIPFPCALEVTRLNPSDQAFDDFGLTDAQNHTYIPNDSLDYRPHSVQGASSGLSIQDANVLKIKVTYGYPLKVPLMAATFNTIMCLAPQGIGAFGHTAFMGTAGDCIRFYKQGRVPIVAYATVQMQTPAWK
jgi:hypothetical protein